MKKTKTEFNTYKGEVGSISITYRDDFDHVKLVDTKFSNNFIELNIPTRRLKELVGELQKLVEVIK